MPTQEEIIEIEKQLFDEKMFKETCILEEMEQNYIEREEGKEMEEEENDQ